MIYGSPACPGALNNTPAPRFFQASEKADQPASLLYLSATTQPNHRIQKPTAASTKERALRTLSPGHLPQPSIITKFKNSRDTMLALEQGLANYFCQGTDSKYFRLCRPLSLCHYSLTLPFPYRKQPQTVCTHKSMAVFQMGSKSDTYWNWLLIT